MAIKLTSFDTYDDSEGAVTGPPNNLKEAQTFTSSGWSIEYIKVYGRRRDTVVDVGNVRLSIQGVEGVDDNPDGVSAGYKDEDGELWDIADAWHTFTFGAAINTSSGTKYAIVMELLEDPAWPGTLYWEYNNEDEPFDGGEHHSSFGGVWGVQPTFNLIFEVWGTVVAPGKPTNPSPTDDITGITLDETPLSWDASDPAADTYEVYFREQGDAWVRVGDAQAAIEWAIAFGTLGYDTIYEWRIDATNAYATTTGDTWTFSALVFDPPLPTGVALVDGEPVGTPTGESNMMTVRRLVVAANDKIWYENI